MGAVCRSKLWELYVAMEPRVLMQSGSKTNAAFLQPKNLAKADLTLLGIYSQSVKTECDTSKNRYTIWKY